MTLPPAYSSVQTTPSGEFIIPDLSFQQGARVFFQGNNKQNGREILNMNLFPGHIDSLSKLTLSPVVHFEKQFVGVPATNVQAYFAALDNDPRFKPLETVVVKTKKRSPLDSLKAVYLSPLFDDGNATLLEPKGNYINIWHFLRGSVPGLKVDGSLDNPSVSFSRYGGLLNSTNSSGEDLSEGFGEQSGVLFFLNEVQVSKDVVSSINPEDVALVAVNRQPMATIGAYNGAIVIFTKKGVSTSANTSKSMSVLQRKGYSPFISPYRVEGNEMKPGATVLFSTLNSPYKTALPSTHTYRYVVAGWNAENELVIGVK